MRDLWSATRANAALNVRHRAMQSLQRLRYLCDSEYGGPNLTAGAGYS
ncbi:MAG TPA: hypothetical protein VG714_04165 [Acidobacteriaceae bacterium]|nr:hypothetical protein [Acidobacteriaceae bacterium]